MEEKHTLGPWQIESGGARLINTQAHVISASDGLGPVAYSTGSNARLIAAAPDLLEALQHIERLSRKANDSMVNVPAMLGNIARAAIAKATK